MTETLWLVVGFAGQACFFLRFIVQWLHSERQKRSVIPIAFWYLSLAGAAIVMAYAIYRKDPVFIIGQTTGSFVYIRNLVLIHAERRAKRAAQEQASNAG
jgi:lipid-A-disaccharide synthase-like uncharacterized protein